MKVVAPYIDISKIDASKRQISVAINLFFKYGDIIAIHTLASASNQVLADLSKKRGLKSMMRHEMLESVKKGKEKKVRFLLNNPENYFKHADRDADKSFRFFYRPTEYMIWDACEMYIKLTGEKPALFLTYRLWFWMEHNDIFEGPPVPPNLKIDTSRRDLFLKMLPTFEKQIFKKERTHSNPLTK